MTDSLTYRHTDVLIVGAGPTGLALACTLAQRGIACRIIERRARASGWSKANLINPHTIEVLAGLGVVERLLAEGVPIRATRVYRGGRVVAAFETPPFPQTAYPFALHLPQPKLEAILQERLTALGGEVERGVCLREFRQDRCGVIVTVVGPDGCEEIRASFLAGCDGSHSTVRERLGVGFAGEVYPESFIVADVRADWEHPAAANLMWLHRDGVMLAWACREPGLWHLFFNLTAEQDRLIAVPKLDDVRRIVAERTGDRRVQLDCPEWISKFAVQRRRVRQFRVGRVFLAGDAAHVHSPMVGKGLGIGVQDGANLGEKLARVLRRDADISLLDAYRHEREPATVDVFRESHATHRLMIPRSAVMQSARDGLMYALRLGAAQRWLLARNFQL